MNAKTVNFWSGLIAIFFAMMIVASCGAPAPAHASESSMYVTALVKAYHSDREMHYNEENPGIGFEYGTEDVRAIGMFFKNSYDKPSTLIGAVYTPFDVSGVKFGALGGVVNHYPRNNGKFGPVAAGYVSKEFGNYGVNMIWAPPLHAFDTSRPTWMFALQLKYKF